MKFYVIWKNFQICCEVKTKEQNSLCYMLAFVLIIIHICMYIRIHAK